MTPLGGGSREAGGESFGWKALSLRLRLRADALLCEGGFYLTLLFSPSPHLNQYHPYGPVDEGFQHAYAKQRRPGQAKQGHQH